MLNRTPIDLGLTDPFAAAIRATNMAMVVTDPHQPDNPIVFVNDAFLKLTGFDRDEVLGRNCRFLQGPGTDRNAIQRVRRAIEDRTDINIDLLNYRKDGSSFFNALYLSPVFDNDGALKFFFASQLDVSDRYQLIGRWESANEALAAALETSTTLVHEIDHRVKNNLQMVSAMILLQTLDQPDSNLRRSLMNTLGRVEALSTVHRRLHESPDVSQFDVADYIRDLVHDLVDATGRSDIKVELDLASVVVPSSKSAAIALLFNEIFTNALKHAFIAGTPGTLRVNVASHDDHIAAVVQDDGVGMPNEEEKKRSFGQNLIDTLARQLSAELVVKPAAPTGTRIEIKLPAGRKVAKV